MEKQKLDEIKNRRAICAVRKQGKNCVPCNDVDILFVRIQELENEVNFLKENVGKRLAGAGSY